MYPHLGFLCLTLRSQYYYRGILHADKCAQRTLYVHFLTLPPLNAGISYVRYICTFQAVHRTPYMDMHDVHFLYNCLLYR